ncbi:hypothetical protein [Amphritea sp. HPY]|uniref:hypothetical protein n=1 Tax=Amphritea sp. HPY TaxID=3421652 RepID=UPI003D7EA486
MQRKQLIPIAEVLDDSLQLSIDGLSQRCAVQHYVIVEMVPELARLVESVA